MIIQCNKKWILINNYKIYYYLSLYIGLLNILTKKNKLLILDILIK
jgi:hypothetical protein